MSLPEGKGLWSRWPRPTGDALARAQAAGVECIFTEVVRQSHTRKSDRSEGITSGEVGAARARGISLIPWAFLVPGRACEAVGTLDTAARASQQPWVVLDVEGSGWSGPRVKADLGDAIRSLHSAGWLVAVTSYGTPWTSDAWTPCLGCDAGLLQLSRTQSPAVDLMRQWTARFPQVGIVAQPAIAAKVGTPHAGLLAGLVTAMRAAGTAGHVAPWVADWYGTHDQRWRELAALEIPGLS